MFKCLPFSSTCPLSCRHLFTSLPLTFPLVPNIFSRLLLWLLLRPQHTLMRLQPLPIHSKSFHDHSILSDPKIPVRLSLISAFQSISWSLHSSWNFSPGSKHHSCLALPLWFSDHSFIGSFAVQYWGAHISIHNLWLFSFVIFLSHIICLSAVNSHLYSDGFQNCLLPKPLLYIQLYFLFHNRHHTCSYCVKGFLSHQQ